jgi:O-antigen/teichoic acid export membrane protein
MKFVKDISTTLLTQFVGVALGIITSIVIARALQPEGKGIYATILTSAQMATMLGSLGVGKSIVYYLGRKEHERSKLESTALGLGLLNGLLAVIVAIIISLVVHSSILRQASLYVLSIGALLPFLLVFSNYLQGLLRGQEYISDCNWANITNRVVLLIAVSALALLLGLSPGLTLVSVLLGTLCAILVYVLSLRTRGFLLRPGLDLRLARGMLVYGLGYQAYKLTQWSHRRFDIFLVGYFTDAANVGYYSTSANLAQMVWNIPVAVSFVLMPWVAGRTASRAIEGTAIVSRFAFVGMSALGMATAVLAPYLIKFAYGESYLPAVEPLRILMPGIVMSGIFTLLGSYMLGRGRLRQLIAVSAAGFGLNMLLNITLLPSYGIAGAALASSVSYTVTTLITAYLAVHDSDLSVWEIFLPQAKDIPIAVDVLSKARQSLGNVRGALLAGRF